MIAFKIHVIDKFVRTPNANSKFKNLVAVEIPVTTRELIGIAAKKYSFAIVDSGTIDFYNSTTTNICFYTDGVDSTKPVDSSKEQRRNVLVFSYGN